MDEIDVILLGGAVRLVSRRPVQGYEFHIRVCNNWSSSGQGDGFGSAYGGCYAIVITGATPQIYEEGSNECPISTL